MNQIDDKGDGALPVRVQLRRTKGWRMPENTVKVDRTTKWGNPWTLGDCFGSAERAVERFRSAVIGPFLDGKQLRPCAATDSYIGRIIANAPRELRGKNLACWCKPGDPCHADVLLELANADAPNPHQGGHNEGTY